MSNVAGILLLLHPTIEITLRSAIALKSDLLTTVVVYE